MAKTFAKLTASAAILAAIIAVLFFTLPGIADFTDGGQDLPKTPAPASDGSSAATDTTANQEYAAAEFPWNANNDLAFRLYDAFRDDPAKKNVFFSPTSILFAMAMTYEGAAGNTASEMEIALGIPSDENMRKNGFISAVKSLNTENPEYVLNVANALWVNAKAEVYDEYVETLSAYYDSHVGQYYETSGYDLINRWAENATNGKITKVINPPALVDSVAVLTNAVYFNGTWADEFDPEDTDGDDFWIKPDSSVRVKMMSNVGTFNYAETDGMEMIQMPYKGDRYSMLVILPSDHGHVAAVEDSLSPAAVSGWIDGTSPVTMEVRIPKFTIKTDYDLIPVLTDMGIKDAFIKSRADFSKMSLPIPPIWISLAGHFAFADVHEKGTEAAAVTVVAGIRASTTGNYYKIFEADRPFIFAIWDQDTKSVLFLGKIADPS